MNLLDKLTVEDRNKITKYVEFYGGANGEFIGVDIWLKYWAENNKKLYRLLGNQLMVEIPYSYEKTQNVIIEELRELRHSPKGESLIKEFTDGFHRLYYQDLIYLADYNRFICLFKSEFFDYGEVPSIKIKVNNKSFQTQKGMKPIRAIGKAIEWYRQVTNDVTFCAETFEPFRIAHSCIYNSQVSQSKIVLSIHPMDFLTMSDNGCNWSSCMSWIDSGCYHAGTVEMMNSNVVLCTYLVSSTNTFQYNIDEHIDEKTGNMIIEQDSWNSKKWRQLFYINKDIILSGKPYPHCNIDLTKKILDIIKELAKKNLNWKYSFGPEFYGDMLGINSIAGMDRAKKMVPMSSGHIYIDTKAMYNDILNDNDTEFLCYRNKPKKGYVLNVSGKAPCVRCGENSILGHYNEWDGYNNRYQSERTICEDCFSDISCYCCSGEEGMIGRNKMYIVEDKYGNTFRLCETHFNIYIVECPCCGKPMRDMDIKRNVVFGSCNPRENLQDIDFVKTYDLARINCDNSILREYHKGEYIPIYLCPSCIRERGYSFGPRKKVKSTHYWFDDAYYIITEPLIEDDEWIKKYCVRRYIQSYAKEKRDTDKIYLQNLFEDN